MKFDLHILRPNNIYKGATIVTPAIILLNPNSEGAPEASGCVRYYTPFHEFNVVDFGITDIESGPILTQVLEWVEATDGHGALVTLMSEDLVGLRIVHLNEADKPKQVDPVAASVAEELSRQAANNKRT